MHVLHEHVFGIVKLLDEPEHHFALQTVEVQVLSELIEIFERFFFFQAFGHINEFIFGFDWTCLIGTDTFG